MKRIVLASGNAGKIREFNALLANAGYSVIPQTELGIAPCPEPHPTFIENALAKARHAAAHSGLPALADDSGICAAALGGLPGIHSARYAQAENGGQCDDTANNAKLNAALASQDNLQVAYVCVLVYLRHADDPIPLITQGYWQGQWQSQAAGDNGFGYDPHFYLPEHDQTAAQLSREHKNQISHRAQAMQQLLAALTRA